ncbi:anti-sigma factor [Halovulum sp. GXIMD14794]
MSLSEEDLMLVSAYHDGELDPDTAARLRARLGTESELRAALDGVAEISSALGGLRPETVETSAPVQLPVRRGIPWRPLALAASVAIAVGLGAWGLGERATSPETPLGWHRHFTAQDYGGDGLDATTRWMGQGPDLSSAELTLVDIGRADAGALFLHYAGKNGCRLTFGTHDVMPDLLGGEGLLTEIWSAGDLHYSLLAVGMDADRFAAISELLREETRGARPEEPLIAGVRDATQRAAPCA